MKLCSPIIIITLVFGITQCAKILGIFPTKATSHYILAKSLMRGLAEKGHDVTVINSFGEKTPPKNSAYRDILLGQHKNKTMVRLDLFKMLEINFLTYNLYLNSFGNSLTEEVLSDPNVQKLLKSNENFDVVIVEQFLDDALKVFAYHFNAHLVVFSTFTSNAYVNPLVANPAPPSYVPEQKIELDHKNFFHRLKNTIIYIFGELNRNLIFFPAQNKIMKKYFPEAPDLHVILYNTSLILLNSHLSTNKAMPRVPNMIDIGGFHIDPPKKLPQDLQQYLDSSNEGVIYFSMGSALQSTNLPTEKLENILRVFSKLNYNILWKWESDIMPGQPPNVKLSKWLPQQDILAHSNVKVFITHGGLLSLIESVYHGIPILALPVYGDQIMNAHVASRNGFGRHIVLSDLTEENFVESLDDVLHNQKFKENMKRRSKIMHDRQNPPLDDADYWIRYVIRHQGATHLRVDGLELPWYQYLSIDVTAFILVLFFLVVYVFYVTVTILCKPQQNSKEKKIKKN